MSFQSNSPYLKVKKESHRHEGEQMLALFITVSLFLHCIIRYLTLKIMEISSISAALIKSVFQWSKICSSGCSAVTIETH